MSTPDAADRSGSQPDPQPTPPSPAEHAAGPETSAEPGPETSAGPGPVTGAEEGSSSEITETQVAVTLQRSVRYTRLLIVGGVLGAVVGALVCLAFPITPESEYTMGQVAGFMAVVGGAIGLGLGGLLGLMLGLIAKRQRGEGVAVQADMR